MDLELDKPQIGQIMAAWQLGYALMQLPSGWFADRIGSRRSLALFIVAWSGMLGAATWCTTYNSLIAVWALMGMAQAGVFPCSTKLIGENFGPTFRATASGLLASSMALGIAIATLLTTQLLTAELPWHTIFAMYAVPGWIWASVFLLSTSNKNSAVNQQVRRSENADGLPAIRWIDFLTSVPMGLLCAQQFFRAAAMMFFSKLVSDFPA